MPYTIKKFDNGYILTDIKGHKYSKKPLTLEQAKRQRTAVILAELRRHKTKLHGF